MTVNLPLSGTVCAGGGRAMIFLFDKSTSLKRGSEKKPREDQGASKK